MLAGVERDVDSDVATQLVGPHPRCGDHVFCVDGTLIGFHTPDPAIVGSDPINRYALEDPGAPFLGHVGHGHGGVDRGGLAVAR